jgi:hypothetical protein
MEVERAPETIVALYTTLADAEKALYELEGAGVPYPDILLTGHTPHEIDRMAIAGRTALAGIETPDHFWSLAVLLEPQWAEKAGDILRKHQPVAVGTVPAENLGRGDTERGAIAWRHYVFETSAATDAVGEYAGTTGNTGVISSGAFAPGALVESNPLSVGTPATHQWPPDQRDQPTSDTMRSDTSADRARPETELKR